MSDAAMREICRAHLKSLIGEEARSPNRDEVERHSGEEVESRIEEDRVRA